MGIIKDVGHNLNNNKYLPIYQIVKINSNRLYLNI